MNYTTRRFWECYNALPEEVQRTADRCYELLKTDRCLRYNKGEIHPRSLRSK